MQLIIILELILDYKLKYLAVQLCFKKIMKLIEYVIMQNKLWDIMKFKLKLLIRRPVFGNTSNYYKTTNLINKYK